MWLVWWELANGSCICCGENWLTDRVCCGENWLKDRICFGGKWLKSILEAARLVSVATRISVTVASFR